MLGPLEALNAVERSPQLTNEAQRGYALERLPDHLGAERQTPVVARLVGIVDQLMRVSRHQAPAGGDCLTQLAGHLVQLLPPPHVVEDLAADDEVEAAGDRVGDDVELNEANVGALRASPLRPRERDLRDVRAKQVAHARREQDRKTALGGSHLECAGG